jgi:cell division protein FtsQ
VLLPADDTASAWSQLARLERSSAILKREVLAIDLRLPDRLVVRVSPDPPKEPAISKRGRAPAKST